MRSGAALLEPKEETVCFEAQVRLAAKGRYEAHRQIEDLLKPQLLDLERDYLWTMMKSGIAVRMVRPNGDLGWKQVDVPRSGLIRFSLDAAPRRTDANGKRRPLTAPEDIEEWIFRKLEGAGLVIRSATALPFDTTIAKRRPWRLKAIKYTGTAEVETPELLDEVFVRGIGSCKSFGFGMLNVESV